MVPLGAGGPTVWDKAVRVSVSIAPSPETHSRWVYAVIEPGTYLWTSPRADLQFLRDRTGNQDVSPSVGRDPSHPPG